MTGAAFADVVAKLEHGMTELDMVREIDHQLRRHGSLGPSFATSLSTSGPHHPMLFGQREATWKRRLMPPTARPSATDSVTPSGSTSTSRRS